MEYKIGDKVLIKSREWYGKNKSGEEGNKVSFGEGKLAFISGMAKYCGDEMTVLGIQLSGEYRGTAYEMEEDRGRYLWSEEMFEPIEEAPTKPLDLVEILKDCPKGTELFSPIFGPVTLVAVKKGYKQYPIIIRDGQGETWAFSRGGHYMANYPGAESMLFPSKEQRDWGKFVKPVPNLPVGTPVMCKGISGIWSLMQYDGDGTAVVSETSDIKERLRFLFIYTVEGFNFADPDRQEGHNYGTAGNE